MNEQWSDRNLPTGPNPLRPDLVFACVQVLQAFLHSEVPTGGNSSRAKWCLFRPGCCHCWPSGCSADWLRGENRQDPPKLRSQHVGSLVQHCPCLWIAWPDCVRKQSAGSACERKRMLLCVTSLRQPRGLRNREAASHCLLAACCLLLPAAALAPADPRCPGYPCPSDLRRHAKPHLQGGEGQRPRQHLPHRCTTTSTRYAAAEAATCHAGLSTSSRSHLVTPHSRFARARRQATNITVRMYIRQAMSRWPPS